MGRLDKLEQNNDTAINQSQGRSKATNPSILRRNKRGDTAETEEVSSVARKHAAATRGKKKSRVVEHEEEECDEGSVGYLSADDEGVENYSDNSDETPPKKPSKKPKARKSSSRARLYAIACGRGGSLALGLYRAEWDEVAFLVEGIPKAKYRKVKSEKEGISFI